MPHLIREPIEKLPGNRLARSRGHLEPEQALADIQDGLRGRQTPVDGQRIVGSRVGGDAGRVLDYHGVELRDPVVEEIVDCGPDGEGGGNYHDEFADGDAAVVARGVGEDGSVCEERGVGGGVGRGEVVVVGNWN